MCVLYNLYPHTPFIRLTHSNELQQSAHIVIRPFLCCVFTFFDCFVCVCLWAFQFSLHTHIQCTWFRLSRCSIILGNESHSIFFDSYIELWSNFGKSFKTSIRRILRKINVYQYSNRVKRKSNWKFGPIFIIFFFDFRICSNLDWTIHHFWDPPNNLCMRKKFVLSVVKQFNVVLF